MKIALLAIPFALVVALVGHVQGSFGVFAVWNALPVALSFVVLVLGVHSGRATRVAGIAFAVTTTLFVTLFHLSWLFDWGGTATSSSTSAVAFIFVPFWACIFGGILAAAAWGIASIWMTCRNRFPEENSSV
ncbi:MAG: hypothetical protein KIT22_13170 [Verrucomicrobiae bacterium]|nr:hypothetical protein [Verrucomicrobiae bacterium]